eukprot:10898779-Karenia_brevis.AAC.1
MAHVCCILGSGYPPVAHQFAIAGSTICLCNHKDDECRPGVKRPVVATAAYFVLGTSSWLGVANPPH